MQETVYVINGYDGQSDGGLFQKENRYVKSVLWFESQEDALRYMTQNAPRHVSSHSIVATTPRELIEVHGYNFGSRCNGEKEGVPWRIKQDRM